MLTFTNSHSNPTVMSKNTIRKQSVKRRTAKQARSLVKIELMFEAALRILEKEPFEAFTTNRIAAVAGVSIGTLYQYFADKDALLVALAEREIEATFERLGSLRQHSDGNPVRNPQALMEARIRQAVQVMAQALGGRLRARKQLLLALVRSGQAQLLDQQILRHGLKFMAAATGTEDNTPAAANELDFVQGFVLARAVSGVLRAALLHDENLLTDPRFEDALCSLIAGYLQQHAPQGERIRAD